MSRTLDNYLQNLINKSTAQFQNALTPLVNQQLERQQQEWEDKRKGSQIADLYKANTAEMLGDDFFNNAKEQRTLADNTRTFLNQQNINQSINKPAQQKSVNEISRKLDVSQSAVSHQLKTLRSSNLVKTNKIGQTVNYSIKDEHIEIILKYGIEHLKEIVSE